MNNYTTYGIVAGVVLAFAIILGNLPLVLLIILFGAIGGVIGAHFDGRINLSEIWYNIIGKDKGQG